MRRAPQDNNIPPEPEDDADDDAGRPSKSALKRQMHSLQSLGQELSELSASRVAKLNLPESLQDALAEYRRTRSHEGRRRQLQFIGKLMRQTDEAPIREAVAAAKLGSAKETLALHEAERWREELLARLLGTMQAPIAKFVRTLNEVPGKFVRTVAAVRDSKAA